MPTVAELFDTMEYGLAPESAGTAKEWLTAHATPRLYINGAWIESNDGSTFDSNNPGSGKPLLKIAQASAADVDAAVSAARTAFESWRTTPGHIRARYLYALARQVQKHSRLLSVLETMDNGKPIRETRDIDIPLVARHFYHHAGWAQIMESDPELRDYEPVGVIGQIIPWNFPLLMLAWKIAPALAMGNTVVLKPAEFTSVSALAFAELCDAAGLPKGVVNVVTGDGKVGEMIVNHAGIDKIAFTGSTEVGRIIRKATAGSGKRLSLELGGKSPFIVFSDADLDSVVEGVVDAIWFNQGQVCCAGSRLLVQESVEQRLLSKLRERMEKLRVGDPLDKAVDIGAIVAPIQLEKIKSLVDQGVREGAELWQPSWSCPTDGYFYPPTLFTNVAPSSTIAQVEIFGPVLVSMTFRTPAEAVQLANNTRYGLAASVWSDNLNLSLDVARKIKAGTVWINSTNLFDAASGFGGYRESGYGREGGREGLYEYIKSRTEGQVRIQRESAYGSMLGEAQHEPEAARRTEKSRVVVDIDRTPKLYIGGKQVRPDSGYSITIKDAWGERVGEVGEGNRKDIRNAVEAAHAALPAWSGTTGHQRAQILYYMAENLNARGMEFAGRINHTTHKAPVREEYKLDVGDGISDLRDRTAGIDEVQRSISRLFMYAAYADKFDGAVHSSPMRGVVMAFNEPIGVIGILAPDPFPLLGLVSVVAPAIAMGNTVIVVPSESHPLSATDFYQVLETSDVPAGVVNIVTGKRDVLAKTLAEHDDVDAVWYFGTAEGSKLVEAASITNMKRTFVNYGHKRDWLHERDALEFLRESTQVKNVWIPFGE